MAALDVSGLTDADLTDTFEAAKRERLKRAQFHDTEVYIKNALEAAKAVGVTKAQVSTFLTRLVNEVYPA